MTIIKKKEVIAMTSLSDRTIDRLEEKGEFPRRRALTPCRVGWVKEEVEAWVAGKVGQNAAAER